MVSNSRHILAIKLTGFSGRLDVVYKKTPCFSSNGDTSSWGTPELRGGTGEERSEIAFRDEFKMGFTCPFYKIKLEQSSREMLKLASLTLFQFLRHEVTKEVSGSRAKKSFRTEHWNI